MNATIVENYLSRKEIGERFSVDLRTIYRWELRGLLTPIRINSRVIRYRESEVFACDWRGNPYTKDSYSNWRKFTESFNQERADTRLRGLTILFHNILMGSINRKKFLTVYLECLDFFTKLIETHGLEDSMNKVIQNADTYYLGRRNIETGEEIRKNVPEMLTTLRHYALPSNQEIENLFDEKDELSSESSIMQSQAAFIRDVGLGYAVAVNRKGEVCKVDLK